MGQKSIISSFFAQSAKKGLAEGQSPPQEIEVSPRSGLYLLVIPKSVLQLHCQKPVNTRATDKALAVQTYPKPVWRQQKNCRYFSIRLVLHPRGATWQ